MKNHKTSKPAIMMRKNWLRASRRDKEPYLLMLRGLFVTLAAGVAASTIIQGKLNWHEFTLWMDYSLDVDAGPFVLTFDGYYDWYAIFYTFNLGHI